jgi:hypothetical protein
MSLGLVKNFRPPKKKFFDDYDDDVLPYGGGRFAICHLLTDDGDGHNFAF